MTHFVRTGHFINCLLVIFSQLASRAQNVLLNHVGCLDTSSAVGGAGTDVIVGAMLHGSSAFRPRFLDLGSGSSLQARMVRSCSSTM